MTDGLQLNEIIMTLTENLEVSATDPMENSMADEKALSAFYSFLDLPRNFARQIMRIGIEMHSNLAGKVAYKTFPPYFQESRPGRPFHTLHKGDSASSETEIRPEHLLYFTRASGDWNVLHFSETDAANTRFKHPIAHGMLVSSFVSALLSGELPGAGTLYESQSFSFKAPVFIGDTITTRVTVINLDAGKRQVTLSAEARNQDGVTVLCGESLVRLMKPKSASG